MSTILNLGCGVNPIPNAVNHDRIRHDDWVDISCDLDQLPWPWDDDEFETIVALDVMEHLELEIETWLDECWRILIPSGELKLRLPAFDNPLSYRDPTHNKVFHPETFFYWDPTHELWENYGRYYWDSKHWWDVSYEGRDNGDLRFTLVKVMI
jgi:methyltransferase family protein